MSPSGFKAVSHGARFKVDARVAILSRYLVTTHEIFAVIGWTRVYCIGDFIRAHDCPEEYIPLKSDHVNHIFTDETVTLKTRSVYNKNCNNYDMQFENYFVNKF